MSYIYIIYIYIHNYPYISIHIHTYPGICLILNAADCPGLFRLKVELEQDVKLRSLWPRRKSIAVRLLGEAMTKPGSRSRRRSRRRSPCHYACGALAARDQHPWSWHRASLVLDVPMISIDFLRVPIEWPSATVSKAGCCMLLRYTFPEREDNRGNNKIRKKSHVFSCPYTSLWNHTHPQEAVKLSGISWSKLRRLWTTCMWKHKLFCTEWQLCHYPSASA